MSQIEDVIRDRTNGTIAAILFHKERHIDSALTPEQAEHLRRVVLREVNGLANYVLEVLRQTNAAPEVVLNEHWLRKIDEVHRAVTNGNS